MYMNTHRSRQVRGSRRCCVQSSSRSFSKPNPPFLIKLMFTCDSGKQKTQNAAFITVNSFTILHCPSCYWLVTEAALNSQLSFQSVWLSHKSNDVGTSRQTMFICTCRHKCIHEWSMMKVDHYNNCIDLLPAGLEQMFSVRGWPDRCSCLKKTGTMRWRVMIWSCVLYLH